MNSKAQTTSNRVLCGILIIACLVGAWIAGTWLMAEYYAKQAAGQMMTWEERGFVLQGEYETALESITRAVVLNDMKADFHHAKGRILEWGLNVSFPADPDLDVEARLQASQDRANQIRRQALNAYQDSLGIRPTWGQTWIRLANLKAQQGEFDNEFAQAYENANRYSTALGELHESLTFLAVRYFDDVQASESLRKTQLDHLAKMFNSRRARQTVDSLNTFRHLKTVCEQLLDLGVELTDFVLQACEEAPEEDSGLFAPFLAR